jgi:molybdenum cofactor biosynthesis enzyme MoaA
MELFGKEISLRTHYCQLYDNEPQEIKEPYINLYVRFKGCNASCKFCEFQNDAAFFDELKFAIVLKGLKEKIRINKIAFTGGEPTLDYKKFRKVVDIAAQICPNSFFVLNSNGYHLNKVLTDDIRMDNISLSRHHYIDKINNEILGFNSISANEIKKWNEEIPDMIHLSCNLIKGYIDSKARAYAYLEKARKIGANSVGFISLMPINQYCLDQFIDFRDMNLQSKRFNQVKTLKYKDMCVCHNYFYIPKKFENIIRVYTKNTCKPSDIHESLVFDGHNLKAGYGNDIIC